MRIHPDIQMHIDTAQTETQFVQAHMHTCIHINEAVMFRDIKKSYKGKLIPLQARCGPEGG